jgi:hypothetical protein
MTAGQYDTRYMKSNAQLTFGYSSDVTDLNADWEIRGPTDWNGNSLNQDFAHNGDETPSSTFCEAAQGGGCKIGSSWEVRLFLHDAQGHTRMTTITLITDDVNADEFRPLANFSILDRLEYRDNLFFHEIYESASTGDKWDVYRIKLASTGDLTLHFSAVNSSDPDATGNDGITKYEWKVFGDYPVDGAPSLEGNKYSVPASVTDEWSYRFQNVTVDPNGQFENRIRVELTVIDRANKTSEKFKMYFVIVPENYGDAEPVVDISSPSDGQTASDDYLYVNGSVSQGSEDGDLMIEVALSNDTLGLSPAQKYQQRLKGKYNSTSNLGDGDAFSIGLKLADLYTDQGQVQTIYIKIVEGDGTRWTIYKQIDVNLVPQTADADPCKDDPSAAGCDKNTGSGTSSDANDMSALMLYVGIGAVALIVVIIVTILMIKVAGRGGGSDAGFSDVESMDPMEAYVQQLIAQGYPEETARAYAAQYAGHFDDG